jgi:hypothetical protein
MRRREHQAALPAGFAGILSLPEDILMLGEEAGSGVDRADAQPAGVVLHETGEGATSDRLRFGFFMAYSRHYLWCRDKPC